MNLKTFAIGIVVTFLIVTVWAQTAAPGSLTLSPLGTLASCPAPAVGATTFCTTTGGVYVSTNGGAYAGPLGPSTAAPTYTKLSCTTASLATGSTGTLTASGCTFQ